MIDLRKIACAALALAAVTHAAGGAAQSPYPTMPVKLIVPFAAGGAGDVVARVLAEKVGAELGQPIVVDNRAGGNGAIGTQAAIRSRPDGYTLLQMSAANVILPILQENIYDWERGLTPVFGLGSVPYAIAVNAKSSIRSIADLVATARSTPGGINYASGGTGSPSHLAPARLAGELKISAVHVPFKGLSGAVQALLGNQVHFVCATTVDVLQPAKAGEFRLLAVTSEQRLADLPDVPTMAELGFADFHPATWYAYLVPANTPGAIVDRLHNALAKAAGDPGVRDRLGKLGLTIRARNGAELAGFMREDAARWRRVIQENQIKIEN
jgi:tripartite-type tricarboxylate transporter receptor subunit TctC